LPINLTQSCEDAKPSDSHCAKDKMQFAADFSDQKFLFGYFPIFFTHAISAHCLQSMAR
jgi:hypothetical protein